MKTNPDYILREIAGEYVLIPTGQAAQQFSGMIDLTDTAAFIWKMVDECDGEAEIISRMTDEYEVTAEEAANDVSTFLAALREKGMIEQ